MELGSLLAPLRLLWYASLYILTRPWMLAASVAVLSTAYLFYRHRFAAESARLAAVSCV